MRILKLEIKNLASLDRECGEVIDFEAGALKNSSIFSIVGPTGSGKSTILDAICLALYNRAPRYPRKKKEARQIFKVYGANDDENQKTPGPLDCCNILSNGKKEGYSRLTFLANNGTVYRAEWSVSFGRIYCKEPETSLSRLVSDNGEEMWEKAVWDDIPKIIGLEYEQFLRTVLIPQGAFASFLAGKEDDRFHLLEKLIGAEEMYKMIASAIKTERDNAVAEFNKLDSQCKSTRSNIIPDEELAVIEDRVEKLRQEENQAKEELKRIGKDLQWYKTDRDNQVRIAAAQNSLAAAQKVFDDKAEERETLLLHDVTLTAVQWYKEAQNAKAMIEKHSNDLDGQRRAKKETNEKIAAGEEEEKRLKTESERAVEEYEAQKPHINAARKIKVELENAQKVWNEKKQAQVKAVESLNIAMNALEDNARLIADADKELRDALQKRDEQKAEVDNKTRELADKAKQDQEAFDAENSVYEALDAKALQTAKSDAETQCADLANAIRVQKQLISKKEEIDNNDKTIGKLKSVNEDIEAKLAEIDIAALEAELETLRKTHTLMTSENWALHRKELRDGEKCPLCGATSHPFCSDGQFDAVVGELGNMVSGKMKVVKENREKINELNKNKDTNNGRIDTLNKTNNSLRREQNALDKEWNEVRLKHSDWQEDVVALEEMMPRCKSDVDDATERLDSYNKLTARINRLRAEKDKSNKALADFVERSVENLRVAEETVTNGEIKLKTEQGKTDNLTRQSEEKKQACLYAETDLKNVENQVTDKKNALTAEIGSNDPEKLDEALDKNVKARQKAESDKRDANAKLREKLKETEGKIRIIEESLEEENNKLNGATAKLDQWIADYNSLNERQLSKEIIAQLSADKRDWEVLRKSIEEVISNLTARKSALEVIRNGCIEHQKTKPSATEEDLTLRESELNGRNNDELTTLTARKMNHDAAIAALGNLSGEIKVAETLKKEWEEINKAIGADGETLRKIAQCYTLRFLVEHANAEIRKFNDRYELVQVKNSLGLRVIDHNRADVVRETTSLSGGETFIVSLGLALGLSALSSRNVSCENLFIDEGFGTLDPETLTTVIDSLRMLQSSQGKKVCIISHTEKMRETIPTQIQLIKDGENGSSHIRIYPY